MSLTTTERDELGIVLDISGNKVICRLDVATLVALRAAAGEAERAATSVGGHVKIALADVWLLGTLTEINMDRADHHSVIAEVDFIGEGDRGNDGRLVNFRRGVTLYPHPGDRVFLAAQDDLSLAFAPRDRAHIEVGTVYPTADVRASIEYDKLLSRHFAVVGSTGTGKSTTVALILHRIIAAAPQGHIVMLDPHGEYAAAFGSVGKVWNVDNLQIPYWVMNLREHCEAFIAASDDRMAIDVNIMAKCLLKARAKNYMLEDANNITADSPIPYLLSDLIEALQDEMSRLDKQAETYRYMRLRLNIEQFFTDPRFSFIFSAQLRNNSMTQLISDLLRFPSDDKPISIIDLAGVPSEIVKVVVSTVSRLIFDYAVWAPRERRLPVLLVCEEAQRYLPAQHPGASSSAERQLERIAREGRKYGVSLGLITQRPSELSDVALSQCGTIIAMRLNNVRDQDYIRDSLPEGARSFIDTIPALQNRECIMCGEGVPVPVRVRLDTLEADLKPASEDPIFSDLWNQRQDDNDLVVETVRRWRGESQG